VKKKACLIWLILLMNMLAGCAKEGENEEDQLIVPPETESRQEGQLGEETPKEKKGQIEQNEEKGTIGTDFLVFYVESIRIERDDNEKLYIYIRNSSNSSFTVSKECFEWYLDDKYMGTVTGVYQDDCKIEATEWDEKSVLCITIINEKGFMLKSMIKVFLICHSYKKITEFVIEYEMFLNSKISIL